MLKGVVGCGWVRCLGCGWVVVVDRRAGMKWVIGRGLAAEVGRWSWLGRGRGWVMVGLWLRWLR